MDSYLSTQQSTIFQHVAVLIYVFEVESRSVQRDLEYYTECLQALKKFSPEAAVFLLVHKMDLVRPPRGPVLEKKAAELRSASGDTEITVFGTSIYDESLYKVCTLPLVHYFWLAQCGKIGLVANSSYPDTQCLCSHEASCEACRRM